MGVWVDDVLGGKSKARSGSQPAISQTLTASVQQPPDNVMGIRMPLPFDPTQLSDRQWQQAKHSVRQSACDKPMSVAGFTARRS